MVLALVRLSTPTSSAEGGRLILTSASNPSTRLSAAPTQTWPAPLVPLTVWMATFGSWMVAGLCSDHRGLSRYAITNCGAWSTARGGTLPMHSSSVGSWDLTQAVSTLKCWIYPCKVEYNACYIRLYYMICPSLYVSLVLFLYIICLYSCYCLHSI